MNPAPRWAWPAGGLVLLAALGAVYAGALAGPFQFDDHHVIVDNPQVHSLLAWWQSLPGIRPLLKLSYALNWAASPSPSGFHLANVAIHLANTALVAWVAMLWLHRLGPATLPTTAGLWVAALFALHPAATESVTYISGRSVSLMALFWLAAMGCFLEGQARGKPWLSQWLATGLFALALAVRETAVTLPAALWLLAWFGGASPRRALRGLGPQLALLAVALVVGLAVGGYDRFFGYSFGTRGLGEQLRGQLVAHGHLFGHTLLGLRTQLDPELVVPATWTPALLFRAIALVAVIALAYASRRRWPWLGFGIAWYLLQLAPTNSLVPRFDLANDRHLYLALPGAALCVVVPLLAHGGRRLGQALLLALALCLALATARRNGDWRSELALWQATVRSAPGKARPWVNLGWARAEAGDAVGARAAWECALRLDPGHAQAAINLAVSPAPPAGPDPACPCP